MVKRSAIAKKGDFILGTLALLVIGGLCLKGAYALCFEHPIRSEIKKIKYLNLKLS